MGGAQREGRGAGSTFDGAQDVKGAEGRGEVTAAPGASSVSNHGPSPHQDQLIFAPKYFINLPLPSTPEVSSLKAHHPIHGLYNQPPNWPPSFLVDLIQFFSYNQSFNAEWASDGSARPYRMSMRPHHLQLKPNLCLWSSVRPQWALSAAPEAPLASL